MSHLHRQKRKCDEHFSPPLPGRECAQNTRCPQIAWVFRYHYTDPDGQRKLKVQTFGEANYKTELEVRRAVEAQIACSWFL